LSEARLKIAVFIDFDNIEIGVKSTLSRHFDVGTVLEAIKERGEVITKVAYGDWTRAGDYSRAMTQHAIHMVQRNLTPGGDKNGADINLALDALEMAFTRDHINAFVIVGGDSDFIALVEKLKQYGKTIFVVGGRSFTSAILQKNCHEFIAYENLISVGSRKAQGGSAPRAARAQLQDAVPSIRRALKVLADREVSPQLGLLKSTLLQLDSTFSERDYGASSFREFVQKLANAGLINLKQVDRSLIVELRDGDGPAPAARPEAAAAPQPAEAAPLPSGKESDGVRALEEIFQNARTEPRWPMYLRNFKQFLRSVDPDFDERRYGFPSVHDLARQAQRDGLLRVERNRQGILRILPGPRLSGGQPRPPEPIADVVPSDSIEEVPPVEAVDGAAEPAPVSDVESAAEADAQEASPAAGPEDAAGEKPKRRRRSGSASGSASRRRSSIRKPKTS
jgi:uncharacterized LabA/DUF88 family protein